MCDEAGSQEAWKSRIEKLRRQLAELGSAVRRLNQAGLDNATADLLLSRKRAELEDLMKKDRKLLYPIERR